MDLRRGRTGPAVSVSVQRRGWAPASSEVRVRMARPNDGRVRLARVRIRRAPDGHRRLVASFERLAWPAVPASFSGVGDALSRAGRFMPATVAVHGGHGAGARPSLCARRRRVRRKAQMSVSDTLQWYEGFKVVVRLFSGCLRRGPGWPCALPRWPSSRRHRSEQQPVRLGRGMPVQTDRSAGTVVVRRPFFERGP